MKKRFLASVLLILPLALGAQTALMMSQMREELQKRGLEETEVRARLLENGIDVDNIPPTEYASYRERVSKILNEMIAEKAAAQNASNATTEQPAVDNMVVMPVTTEFEFAAEEDISRLNALNAQADTTQAGDDRIYGHSIFSSNAMSVFRTTDGAQAPDTYVLGEGDEVHISIFGSSQTEIHQRIGADGSIQPTGSTKIFLKGMTLAKAREAIRSKLSSYYSFRQDQIAVTITTARTISVGIYGEVGVQGGFTLSALNTAFNALAAAGGPTEIGSVRNIQLSRSGKNSRLDLYSYMTNADPKLQYDLQNGDVLFVPVAQKIVEIEGGVNRPMKYEMIEGEGLKELIALAGGLRYNVTPEYVQVERYENGQRRFLEYDLKSVMSGSQKIDMHNGDKVLVRMADKPLEDYVRITGDVYYPGSYDLMRNGTLQSLIDNAQPKISTKTDYVFVERMRPDSTVTVLTVPYPGVNGNPDFSLQSRDVVRVLGQTEYRDVDSITVAGQVRSPFSRVFGLNDRMTVSQAIEYAGGLRPNVFPVGYIFRRDITNPSRMEYLKVSLERDGDMLLQPGDSLNIYDNTTYTNIGEVRVSGAVKNPFVTGYDPSLTVHDLLMMAGGLEVGAAYNRVEVFRMDISDEKEVNFDLITLEVDENYYPEGGDFQIRPYDNIVVRMTPNFSTGRTVELNGRVKYPGVYILEDSKTQLSDVVKMAGGLLDDADPYATLFRTYRNRGNIGLNLNEARSNKGKLKADPILMDGDVINIVRQENTVFIRETGTRMSQYVVPDFESTQKIVVFQGNRNAAWYVRHYAGGFLRTADKNSVTVTFPNNQAESVKRGLFGIRRYPTVQPGGVISMRIDEEKVQRIEQRKQEEKKKVDWEQTFNSTLSSLTSIVSIILLVDRLK